MANDLSNPVQANPASGDGFFEHGAGQDSLFGTVQLAQNGTAAPTASGQIIQVTPPQGAAGPVVIRVEVTPGSTVDLPQPFQADAALMAREGDGNLAIKIGDVTVILEGYVDANQTVPVTIEGADNEPIDIATILASTDPTIDIQTAAGPDAGQNGQGADNSGAILAQLEDGNGLGGFEGAGAQDGTELAYRTIDASIRNDFADTLDTASFGFSVGSISGSFGEGFLRDPAQTSPFNNSQGSYFATFLHEYQDAVENPGQAMFAGWADFHGTGVTGGDFEEYLSQTSQVIEVDANFTGGTGDLVLTGIVDGVQSNHSDLKPEFKDGGHTMFLRREDDHALVAVVHVEGPDASGHFTIETILINRLDHSGIGEGDAGKDSMDIEILFKVYDGPAPNQENHEQPQPIEGGENNDVPEGPTSPSIDGSFKASFADDVPILEKVTYHNQHDGGMAARSEGGSTTGLIDEDWLRGGDHDKGINGDNSAAVGDSGGGTCVTGCIRVNFGADGAALSDGKTEDAGKHAFVLDTTKYTLNEAFPYGNTGLTSGGKPLVVLSLSGDHLTVGIAGVKQPQPTLVEGKEGDTSGQQPTDPIPGRTIFTLTLNQATGQFEFDLKGPLDHGASIFGTDTGVSALVAPLPENTIPLEFHVKAYDDDGDSVDAEINIDVNDDMPVARDDSITVLSGSHDEVQGAVISAWNEDSAAGKDSLGADGAIVIGVAAGDLTADQTTGVGDVIQGAYGKLKLGTDDGKYTYTRDPYTPGGVDDVFTYTLKDGDGDTSTATLTIHIQNAEVSIDLPTNPADTTVYEAGLPDGSNAGANSEHTEGTITITAKDGIQSLEIGGETLTLAQLKDLGTTHPEISDSDGKLTLTGFDEATGKLTYTYDLTDNNSANSVKTVSFDIKVTDVDNDVGTAKLEIDIVDDTPSANCDTITATAGRSADIQFIVDVSGSMKDAGFNVPSPYADTGIGLERYAMAQLLTGHPEVQNVQFVIFSDHASHSVWMTATQALVYLQSPSNFPGGGATNYDLALTEAMSALGGTRPLPQGDQTLVYFFSDGDPNQPNHDAGIDTNGSGPNVSQAEWETFVNKNDITNVFTVGIGNVTSGELAELTPIAYPNIDNKSPSGVEDNFVNLSNSTTTTLVQTLTSLVSTPSGAVTGNVTTNDVSGADGFGNGKLVSVSYEGTPHAFSQTIHQVTLELGEGRGKLVINDDGSFTYTPPAGNADGVPFHVDYTIQDGDGDTSTAALKIDLKAAPRVDLDAACDGNNGTAGFVEDQPAVHIAPSGTVNDDGTIGSMTVTLTNRPDGDATERLDLASPLPSGLSSTYVNGVLTITGPATAAVYQAVLQSITYNNTSQNPNGADRTVTVTVKDTESTPLSSITHIVTVSVTAVNDAPDAEIAPLSYAANEDQSINLSGKIGNQLNMMISDPDSGSDDVTVTISVTEGKLTVEDGWTGVAVSNNNSMSVTLKGSVAEINNLLKESNGGYVRYVNENNNPSSQVTLTLKVNDNGENGIGGAKFDQDTATITITPVNDKPVTDLNGGSYGSDNAASFTEDSPAVKIAPNGTISDVDSSNLASMTVTITNLKDGSAESLSINPALLPAGVTASYSNGVLAITGSTSVANYQTILKNIVYNNSSDTPNTTNRSVTVVVSDGSLTSDSHISTISVTPHNDAPTAQIFPASYAANEDQTINISGKIGNQVNMLIGDPDSAGDDVYVTLSVTQGKLDVNVGTTGVSIWSGDNTSSVTIKGSVSEINNLLKESNNGYVKYVNDSNNPAAHVTLTLSVNDDQQNGTGQAETASATTTIDITPVNDKPVTDLNGGSSGSDSSASFNEDSPAVKIAPNGTISDVDSSNLASMTVTITNLKDGSAESLSINPALLPAGITATYLNGVLTITGSASVSAYQGFLQNIVYNNTSDTPNTTNRSVTVVVSDGSLTSDSHTSTISVSPHNDAPTATALQSGLSVNEQVSLNIAGKGLSVADVDAGSDTITVKLTVDDCGVLTATKGGANVSIYGSGSGTVTIYGSQSEINKVLNGTTGSLTFKDDTDAPHATVKLTMTVDDEGNNGNGADGIATVETTIAINAINDGPTTCDDHVYTNAGSTPIGIAEWMLTWNDGDPDSISLGLPDGNGAVVNVTGSTVSHPNGAGDDDPVSFTDTNGNTDSKFDYTLSDGSGGTATGHVTVHQDKDGGTLYASAGDDIVIAHPTTATTVDAGDGNDVVVGSSKADKLDGGDGDDLIFGGGGNDSLIYSSDSNSGHDKYDGGDGFDRLQVTGGGVDITYDAEQFKNIEMIDLYDAKDRSGSSLNEFSLKAFDLLGTTGESIGNKAINLFVIGDQNGNSNGRDTVNLHDFSATTTKGDFTDASGTHNFTVYTGTNSLGHVVNVAVETGLTVHTD